MDVKYCQNCGGAVSEGMMECPHCHCPLQTENVFCELCRKPFPKSQTGIVKDTNGNPHRICVECYRRLAAQNGNRVASPETQPTNAQQPSSENAVVTNTPAVTPAETAAVSKKRGKRKITIFICVVVVVFLVVSAVVGNYFLKAISLTEDEQYVCNLVKTYRTKMNDPDSLILRGDALLINNTDFNKNGKSYYYTYFEVSGKNSFGGYVTETVMFSAENYAGTLEEDVDGYDNFALMNSYSKAQYYRWKTTHLTIDGNYAIEESDRVVNLKKIARKLKCQYQGDE